MLRIMITVLFGFLATIGVLMVLLVPAASDDIVAVVYPYKWGEGQVINAVADSGGLLVSSGKWPFIKVVSLENKKRERILKENGAWFVLNPVVLRGCGLIPENIQVR
jgi:hypothetical protein